MSAYKLEIKDRKAGTKGFLNNLRKESNVPGVIYGVSEPKIVAVDYNSLLKVLAAAGTSSVIDLKLDGKEIKAIVREYQQDPVTDKITHVDFYEIQADKEIETEVPLHILGEAPAVKEKGGHLFIKLEHVTVKCLPDYLPHAIELDVSGLTELNTSLKISDLKVDSHVQILDDQNAPVVTVAEPKKVEVVTAEATAPVEGAEGATPAEGATSAEGAEGATPAEEGKKEEQK